jgi:hypothetical protein
VSKRLDYNQIAPAGAKALGGVYGYVMQSSLPPVLIDLVYLRVSQINNCAYVTVHLPLRPSYSIEMAPFFGPMLHSFKMAFLK